MRYHLTYRGRTIALGVAAATVGRSAACTVILDSDGVSRRHARLAIQGGRLMVFDLDSANGVFVNGEPIDGKRTLVDGDRILIGSEELRVSVREEGGPDTKPPSSRRRALDDFWDDTEDEDFSDGEETTMHDTLPLLATAAKKLVESGDAEGAETALAHRLGEILERAQSDARTPPSLALRAARLGLGLALATGKTEWLAYARSLAATGKPKLQAKIDDLITVYEAEIAEETA